MKRIRAAELAHIAVAAGPAILEIYRSGESAARGKADGSPVTLADEQAEALITASLKRLAPHIPIVAEEACARGDLPSAAREFFLVDPLDGTKEFLSGNGEFTVNIALIDHGAPICGAVYAPALDLVWVGDADGAWRAPIRNGRISMPLSIRARTPPADGFDVLASRSHMDEKTRAFIGRAKVRDMKSAGSSLKFCRIAEGAADLYPRFGRTMEWDTAAGDAVLRAAGGHVVGLDGHPLSYGRAKADAFANPSFIACGNCDPAQFLDNSALE